MSWQRNIKLVRYKKFGAGLILFEHINAHKVNPILDIEDVAGYAKVGADKTFLQQFESAPSNFKNIYETTRGYILSLGDDVTENQLKLNVAIKKSKT